MYRSQCEALLALPADDFKESVAAIWEYALNDREIECGAVATAMYRMCKPLIDSNNSKARNKREQNGTSENKREQTECFPEQSECFPEQTECFPEQNGTNENKPGLKEKGERRNIKKEPPKGGKKESAPRFHPPSVDEVRAYAIEKGYNVDAERFVDFYTSKGWKVGSAPMKDWKAAVRNWARSERQGQATKPKNNSNFQSRDIDLDNLLKAGGLYG